MKTVIRWLPCVACMSAIFFFSSRTGDELNSVLPFFRWFFPAMQGFDWGHFVAYFVLALTFLWAFPERTPSFTAKIGAVVLCLLYGLTDEIHQLYVPGRMFDLADLRNDGIGAAMAMLAASLPAVRRIYGKLHFSNKF